MARWDRNIRLPMTLLLAVFLLAWLPSTPVLAQDDFGPAVWETQAPCTNFTQLAEKMGSGPVVDKNGDEKVGKITQISNYIKETVGNASQNLFEGIIGNDGYQNTVNAAAILMVVIYGVGFTIGVIQATFSQAFIRLIRLGIVYTVVSPDIGWAFFNSYVVAFFNQGTDDLIGGVIEIGTGLNYTTGDSPFLAFDHIAELMLSPDMIIAILGSFTNGGPYSLISGGILGFALMGVLKLLVQCLRIYAVSFVLRSLLLGLAPIFIVFLLFDKTRMLFMSWVNALVNQSLTPILYFTFTSFFLLLIFDSSKTMLNGAELCWAETTSGSGTTNKIATWRFKMKDQSVVDPSSWKWEGAQSCLTKGEECPSSPLNLLNLLTFVVLIYVATKFAEVVDNIAMEISNSFVGAAQGSKSDIVSAFSQATGSSGGGGGSVNPQASAADNRLRGGRG
jgi:type IV secretory pathway VirB6-like protein